MTLGDLLQATAGRAPFDARIAAPLGMTSTRFDEIDGERFRHAPGV